MSFFKKSQLIRNHNSIKNLSYTKGNMSLNLSVDIEKKQDIKDLLEILKVAQEELEEMQPDTTITKNKDYFSGGSGGGSILDNEN